MAYKIHYQKNGTEELREWLNRPTGIEIVFAHIAPRTIEAGERIEVKFDRPEVKDGWISVKERLPKENGWYVVYVPLDSGHYEVSADEWSFGSWMRWDNDSVTHWMPLPDPPNGQFKGIPIVWDCPKCNLPQTDCMCDLKQTLIGEGVIGEDVVPPKENPEIKCEWFRTMDDIRNIACGSETPFNPREELLNLCNEFRVQGNSLRFATLRDLFLHKIDQLKKEKK